MNFETVRVPDFVRFVCRCLTVGAVGLLMFLAAPLRYDYHAQQPTLQNVSISRELVERATILRQTFANNPKAAHTETEYLDLIGIYQRAVRLDTEQTVGDAALIGQAEVFREMGSRFQKTRYFYSAIGCYQNLLETYETSPHTTRALISIAQIYEHNLRETNQAARAYQLIVEQYPSSVSAREAMASLARIGTVSGGQATGENVLFAASQDDQAGITTIGQIRHFSGPDYARVILDLSIPATYERSLNGSTLVLRLPSAKVSPLLAGRPIAVTTNGLLKNIRYSTSTSAVEVAIECTQLRDFAIFALDDPPRLVVDLRGSRSIAEDAEILASTTALPSVKGAQQTAAGDITLMRALGLKVKRIVIDPGHGGSDFGATGKDNIYEKDVVLDIALRLRAAIQQRMKDVEVILTRDSDRFIPLEERTAIANSRQADLFISIHTNSSPSSLASGVETYFLSRDASKEELEVATRENATTSRNVNDLLDLLQQIALNNKVAESRDFAQHVQTNLVNGLTRVNPHSGLNRGVKKAPFVVLVGTSMPSILAEVSFISYPKDADALRTIEFRQTIAESLFSGIQSYVETLSKGLETSSGN